MAGAVWFLVAISRRKIAHLLVLRPLGGSDDEVTGLDINPLLADSAGVLAVDARVAVAALWLGDVIGGESPLGKLAARYDVTALVDVTTIHIPLAQLLADAAPPVTEQTGALYSATARRLQGQISMRLAGNGLQRLVSVMATLATALTPDEATRRTDRIALPVAQRWIGQLSGLSRRQAWLYLGQLREHGWLVTSRSQVTLEGLRAWLALMPEVEAAGLECIATLPQCHETLMRLSARTLAPD